MAAKRYANACVLERNDREKVGVVRRAVAALRNKYLLWETNRMSKDVDPRITPWRATVAYVTAFLAGSLVIATMTCVTWFIENDYPPSHVRHLFATTFLFPLLVAGIASLAVLAPLLSPIYVLCILAIQKRLIRRWPAFIALGTVFASMGWLVISAYYCVISTCSTLSLTSMSRIPLAPAIELIAIGAASGMVCRCVLFR
jgi:hypothetical protein